MWHVRGERLTHLKKMQSTYARHRRREIIKSTYIIMRLKH